MDHLHELTGGSAAPAAPARAQTMAVLVTDVVGSTRLRSAVGDVEATELIVVASTIVANAVTAHGGVVRRRTGDGERSTFASVRAALRAAAAIQGLLARRPLVASNDSRVRLRIGVCVGEVEIDRAGGVSGAPIRSADRLTERAPIGGIGLCPIAATMARDVPSLETAEVTDEVVQLLPKLTAPSAKLPGRGVALAQLEAVVDSVAQGRGGMVVVHGEVGSGRSRLIEESRRHAEELGLRVLQHRCVVGSSVGRAAIIGLVEEALACVDADTLLRAAGDDLPVLSHVFSGLGVLAGSDASEGDLARVDNRAIVNALTSFLRRAAATRPLVLLIDDYDLADAGTRAVMARLAPEFENLGVLVIVSVGAQRRAETVETWRELAPIIRAGHAGSVLLRPLEHAPLRELLDRELASQTSDAQVEVVLERTGGNVALAVALARQARASHEDVATVSPPEDALIPLRAQIDDLDAVGRQALELLAVLGKPTTLALLVAFIDQPEGQILAAVEHAERAGIVVARELAGETFLWFAQGLVHELMLAETGGVARTCWARRGLDVDRDIA